ncbi:MAG: M42 family metallopeptidase [Candidatus Mcinerneyibacterium aminivorans]|uniref:M42 family metallopeptidase n=1 Tax=Candidatus Mcinerneyibacterium aminivorans TaxID=2703815 RepID=A0A5D0MKS9_9BACT|nr:MAG: M42 family metallopeptidase [Candidatus Mcinerneyibacterium aminivorans]
MKNLIKEIVETFGPSGREDDIREKIAGYMKAYVDEIKQDSMGNLICIKKGKGPKIMVAAHMDEIGVITTHITKKGFLRFSSVGGVSPVRCLYQRVVFENGVKGVIGTEPVDKLSKLDFDKLFIDIGAKDREEAQKMIKEGTFGAFTNQYDELNDLMVAKSMDDRIGCAVAIKAAEKLKKTDNEIYFVFTTQEEVGLRGAKVSAYNLEPDLGIAIDVTGSGDTPEAPKMPMKLRNGVAIKVKDSSVLVPKKVKDFFIQVAEKNHIDYQLEVLQYGGTDAGAINLTKSGIMAGVLSIPTRYIHSVSEVLAESDVKATVTLLTKILESDIKNLI